MAIFCLVHGFWHDGSCWEALLPCLRARGHDAVAPDLPYDDPKLGFQQRIRPAVRALDRVSGPVVAVGHSAGSDYAALIAAARPGSLLVHLCPRLAAFAPPAKGPGIFREGFPFPPGRPDGTTVWKAQSAVAAMYPRLPPRTAHELARRLRPAAPAPGEYPLRGHPDVPTALVYAREDEIFEPAWQRRMARELLGIEPVEIAGGHFPMVEDPDGLAGVLDRLAREHGASRRD